jgi:Na+-transporting NADH:ubiquinone oxidoreductase subunit F
MSTYAASETRPRDYGLLGKDGALAVQRGLADAKWYASPVPKDKMRELLERRDGPAIRDTLLWFALLFGFGVGGYLLWGTLWAIIPFALYSTLYGSTSDARWHESGHGTAFKTDWLNNALYEIASFMVLRESTVWRWSHARHHSDTIIVGRDREIAVPRPAKPLKILLGLVNVRGLYAYFRQVALHCTGRLSADEKTFIPASAYGQVILRARIYAAIYLSVIGLAVYMRSILPLLYIGLPNLYGVWLVMFYGLTQHAGLAEDVLDHRLNSRTVYMNRINRYLYWNMGYHVEHHMFPLVPYHALPRLHELVKADMPKPYNSLLEAYREIIPTLIRQSKDLTYFVRRPVPPPVARPDASQTAPAITAEGKPVINGWIEVGSSGLLQREDVVRFDHANTTYAIYRTADNKVYATEGMCTHGNALLADGFVQGNIIECPKHNGRYDIRDGSPQRLPVCVGLKTFDVRESNGLIYLNLKSAHGTSLAEAARSYTFRVVSNHNVAAFIKELVLEVGEGSPALVYQPGDYMQFDIPAYGDGSLREIAVEEAYAPLWEALGVFDLRAANPMACRRSYSFASHPAEERRLRFNIRLATPPRGQIGNAGVGSAYLFGLKPGDTISATGPFGAFHILPTGREMVYLGGGAGMAPLRSHLSYLLETQKTERRVSYWYGARSLKELFYQDYFEKLASKNPNFSFHVALSEPRPEDGWQSHTGFIHEVLKREYLDSHRDPTQIEYYLCGPLPMIRAAISMLEGLGVARDRIISDEF